MSSNIQQNLWIDNNYKAMKVKSMMMGMNTISINKINNELKITDKDGETKIVNSAFPSVHWHPNELKAKTIINLLTGDVWILVYLVQIIIHGILMEK